ncbi:MULTISPECIES: S-adenosyl-l-methionine hydroxide adenosyltransferase family protein [unclassified Kaistella]|uniref:SAM hydrolase/SAM-dependent halogenase family protein n=1 Tax=unclassified Kaistella TaxID=2762626 RepID=UPI002733106B|nr:MULTISPECIES: SAM-dependent chlorinase/fluorinase [unclassified Kaistella]MCZ2084020.1 SAM-dependent chlorinase/fluorinase [Flavobacteriales bacterium]MDP2454810.1 SAM-dependent chlorinase/fluorinase [Kaistella sp. SH11-4b]MDP2457547.1 SAM-dependent chlorinase/fluorinase [Kaistella sp. SH40-3]MDP2460307.1 SAM-dependent chlorinase/fluorinase [Kaistella sp. SH19-2b]
MAVITFTSDYGLIDHRVAAVKGAILNLKEEATIVDITHQIQAYNLLQTAYIVRNAYSYFPKGTVHIISVDSFYTKERKCILYKADDHYFIAADNGVLSLIFYDINPEAVYEITFNNRFDDEVRFTSTDIFAPVAVHLQNGGLPEVIGRKFNTPKQLSFPRAVFNESEKMLIGEIMYIDNFGNVVSNISRKNFEKSSVGFESFIVKFRNLALSRIHNQYTDLVNDWQNEQEFHGKAAAVFNDAGLLELTIYKGNEESGARSLFGLQVGESIYVQFQ